MNIELDKVLIGLASLIGAVSGLYALLKGRRKDNADLATTYENMAQKQALQITELRNRVDELEEEVKCLTEWVEALIEQLKKAKIVPAPKPEPKKL